MKKGKKISLIVLISVALIISVIWVSRSIIIKKILIETVADRSNGDMVLNLEEVDYNPFKKKIEILDLSLIVSSSDTLDMKQTKLRSVSFDSIIISDFDLGEILFEKKIKAGKIVTAKPDIVFSHTQKQNKNHTSIGGHFNSVETNDVKLKIFPIEIGVLKVEYGNVLFEADSTNNYLGSADFWVELHEFNTTVDSIEFDSNSFLFSKRLIIDISNFSKPLKNDKDLNIENLKFDSKTDKLEVSNFSISTGKAGLNSPLDSIFLRNIEIDGLSISEIKKEKDLILRSIKVNDGFVKLKPFSKSKNHKVKISQETLSILFQFIKGVDIDTLSFANIGGDIVGHNNNRLASIEDFGFNLLGLSVDTSMYYRNSLPDFDYFGFSIKRLTYDSLQQFEIHNASYNSHETNLKISNVLFKDAIEKIDFTSSGILLEGLEIKKILNKKSSNILLSLTNPKASLNLSSNYFSNNKSKSNFSDLVHLNKVVVTQADISLFNDKGLFSEIFDLDISFCIVPNGEDTLSKLNLKDLKWATKQITFSLEDQNIQFSSSSSAYFNENLNFSDGKFKHNQNKTIDIDFQYLSLSKFNIVEVINSNKFMAEQIIMNKPVFDLAFSHQDSLKSAQERDSVINLPMEVSIGNFTIQDAKFNLNLEQGNTHQSLFSNLNLSLNGIELPGILGLEQIQQLGLDLNLLNTKFENDNVDVLIETFNFSTSDSSIRVQNINFKLDSIVSQGFVLSSNRLIIEDVELTQLDYIGALQSKDISFNKLKITNPDIDLYSYGDGKPSKRKELSKLWAQNFSNKSFREVEIENLKLNYKMKIKGSEKNIKIGNFNFVWSPKTEENSNLLSELLIDLKDFELLNSENQTNVEIGRVFTNKLKNDLEINEIVINKQASNEQNGIFIRLPLLELKNVIHNEEQAYKIEINELSSDTLIVEFNKSVNEPEKINFSGRVEALEKYSDLIKKFNIRKSSFHNVDININNLSDTSHKEFILDEMDIFLSDVGFNTSDSSMLHLKKITLDLKGRKLITADSLYEISTGEIFYDFANSSITIDSFKLKPRYGMDDFFKKSVFQTTMLDVTGEKIVLSGIDFQRAITKKEYLISSIDLDGFKLLAHRDKNYPFKHGVIKPFPSEILRNLSTKFYVDSVRVNNSYILFGLYVEGSHKPGELFFENVNITINELSNMSSLMSFPPVVKLGFKSKVMGNSLVTAKMNFPLNSNGFNYSGKTDEIDFRDFNSMTQNLFGISITKGKGNIDIIGINAGDSIATGSIKFKYKKLRVGLYDREKAQLDKGIAAPFFRFLVNDLLIRSNNPRFLGKTRTGLVYIEPNREKSFINYTWKGLLSGMMSTMWHNSKEQKKEKRRIKINDN